MKTNEKSDSKVWRKYTFDVNGFNVCAEYTDQSIECIFLPMLQYFTWLQKKKGRRIVVFLAAPPAVGKTTLTQLLVHLSQTEPALIEAQALGLDGFHYHSEYIASHDVQIDGKWIPMKRVKGCPETFDTKKLAWKLHHIQDKNLFWPLYDRTIHDVLEEHIPVKSQLLLLEGNYFLLREKPWDSFYRYADCTIMVTASEELLQNRLIDRKISGGSTLQEAEKWYRTSDRQNILRVLRNSRPGDINLSMDEDGEFLLTD